MNEPITRTPTSEPTLELRPSIGARRGRHAITEAAVDEAWLRWIAQHRFVGIEGLVERFDVSRAAAWRRLRRLVDARLLVRRLAGATTIVFVAERALRLLELPRRKPPRAPLASLAHDLAIARWHAILERTAEERGVDATVLSERGLRQLHSPRRPYCAWVAAGGGRTLQRWADVAVEFPSGALHAYELEFTEKSRVRLEAIVRGYSGDPRFARVTYLVTRPALAARIAALVVKQGAHDTIAVQPWFDIDERSAEELRHRVATVFATLPQA